MQTTTIRRCLFQSTCPARGTTTYPSAGMLHAIYFNPRAPRGARLLCQKLTVSVSHFNPRAPRGARRAENVGYWGRLWISIHVPREGHDDAVVHLLAKLRRISIHVPREGHDTALYKVAASTDFISIHVPREGHDLAHITYDLSQLSFQSTCPARGTTMIDALSMSPALHFNPRAPRGARLHVKH